MECRAHALTGAVAFAAAAPLLHITGPDLASGIVLTAGAALLPDIDEPGSTISREGGFLTMALAWAVRKISGGHRKGTHSALGVAVFAGMSAVAAAFWSSIYAQVLLFLFIGLLLGAAAHALHFGGHHGDLLASVGAAAAVYWHAGLPYVPLCIAIGAIAHICGDELTHSGCPLLYPFSKDEYHLLPEPLRFTTGKVAEHAIVTPLLLAALGVLIWHDTGATSYAHHLHTALARRNAMITTTTQGARPEDWRVAQERTSGPVHTWFELTYANFLVWHRAHMQSMPVEWQQRFVDLAEELDAAYPDGAGVSYEVTTVRSEYVSELTEDEMRQLDISTSDAGDEDEEWDGVSELRPHEREYYLKDGSAVPGVHRVGIPVPDPVPHYNRGRTYLAPDEDGIAACLSGRQRRADLDKS